MLMAFASKTRGNSPSANPAKTQLRFFLLLESDTTYSAWSQKNLIIVESTGFCGETAFVVFLLNQALIYADKTAEIHEDCIELKRRFKMGIQNWSENIVLVDLPQEPEMADELKNVIEIVRDRGDCDVVVDFSSVDIITSSSLSKLLKLRKMLADCEHRLVFCSVAAATRGIFTVTGLDGIFELVDDKFVALAGLQMVS